MTPNEELERPVERLADVEAVLGQGQGGIARDTDFARRVASDLRALLSERAELLAAVERMRGALEEFSREYDGFEDGDGFPCPTLARARAALTTGEANHKDKP